MKFSYKVNTSKAVVRRNRGMAMVITLTLVVIVSAVLLAFFTQATSNRMIESNRSRITEADILARAGSDYVTGQIFQEIDNNSQASTFNNVTVYKPLQTADSIPQRLIASSISASNADFFNLIRESVPGADSQVSSDSVAVADRSGRIIAASRWNTPELLAGGGFNDNSQLPHWIYTTRSAPATATASADTIGRFAYTVYDIGGLININIAGHPDSVASTVTKMRYTQCNADLTQLPGVSQQDVNNLVTFRNPGVTADNYASYLSAARQSGWLSTAATDVFSSEVFHNNYFVSRQDLLRYVHTQNKNFEQALPYLTTFARTVAAPSWMPPASLPGSNVNYATNADSSGSANRNLANVRFSVAGMITHYDDTGAAATYSAAIGDSLLQRRFSLARVQWLTPTGPQTGISDAAIQACFGLRWNAGEERWDYVGSTGATVQSSIETLDQVASEQREPNFLELLKAGILQGSLGLSALQQTDSGTGNAAFDSNKDLHLLRIAANIINAGNTDNYPRILAMSYNGTVVEVAGQADLPYLYCLQLSSQFLMESGNVTNLDFILIPVFIAPNRTYSESANSGPVSVTCDIASGVLNACSMNNGNTVHFYVSPYKSLASSSGAAAVAPITIEQSQFAQFRSRPGPQTSTTEANRLSALVPYMDGAFASVQAFRVFSYQNEAAGVLPAALPTDSPVAAIAPNDLIIRLTYKTPSGKSKTYYTMGGNDASSLVHTTGICDNHSIGFGANMWGQNSIDLSSSYILACQDARTGRLGAVMGWARPDLYSLPINDAIRRAQPMPPPQVTDATASYLGWWPQGGKTYNSPFNYYANNPDPDETITGTLRPADGWLGDNANPYNAAAGSTSLDAASTSRPFILQRAFRSVAELGSVFRDTPWKSLSFFDETSADGALLDLFTTQDEPAVTAGRIFLSGRQPLVKQALVGGAPQEPDGTNPLSSAQAEAVAAAFTGASGFAFTSGQTTSTIPVDVAGLPGFMSSAALSGAGLDNIKYHREAVVRALADTSQTRTWNLLIDVVAQSGRFPRGTSVFSASNFVVGGEKRYWLSIAIDRFTGKIIDKQLEEVAE